jgi:ParB family chromosome partitioning protein
MSSDRDRWGATGVRDLPLFNPTALTIVTDKSHELYDERVAMPVTEELVMSIMKRGVIEPIIVRYAGRTKEDEPIIEVIDGRQRVKAAVEANRRLEEKGEETIMVPATMRKKTDGDLMGLMIVANELRFEDSPINRAQKLSRYLDRGRSIEQASEAFGKSVETLKNLLLLLDLDPSVQEAIEKDGLSQKSAREMLVLPDNEQQALVEKLREEGKINGRSAKPVVEAATKERKGKKAKVRKASSQKLKLVKELKIQVDILIPETTGAKKVEALNIISDVLAWAARDEKALLARLQDLGVEWKPTVKKKPGRKPKAA